MVKNLPIAPYTNAFIHYQGPESDSQVLNISILIILIQLRVLGLRMLSTGQHVAVLRPNLSVTRLRIAISEHLLTA